MHGRSFVSAIAVLALTFAERVSVSVAAEDVATAEQSVELDWHDQPAAEPNHLIFQPNSFA